MRSATFFAAITECLNEAAADGLCYSYGVLSGFGTMPNWDTSEVTNMNGAFSNRATLEADLSGWNTAQVTDMREMFLGASLFNADISNWDTSNVQNMTRMFVNAKSFNRDISGWIGPATSTLQTEVFSGATLFKARFVCNNVDNGPINSCFDLNSALTDSSFAQAVTSCPCRISRAWFVLRLGNAKYQLRHDAQLGYEQGDFNEKSIPWFKFLQCGYFFVGYLASD